MFNYHKHRINKEQNECCIISRFFCRDVLRDHHDYYDATKCKTKIKNEIKDTPATVINHKFEAKKRRKAAASKCELPAQTCLIINQKLSCNIFILISLISSVVIQSVISIDCFKNKYGSFSVISAKPCQNALGQLGTCMFMWDCIKSEGLHLGTCSDRFLFGSCCHHNSTANDVVAAATDSSGVQIAANTSSQPIQSSSSPPATSVTSRPSLPAMDITSTQYPTNAKPTQSDELKSTSSLTLTSNHQTAQTNKTRLPASLLDNHADNDNYNYNDTQLQGHGLFDHQGYQLIDQSGDLTKTNSSPSQPTSSTWLSSTPSTSSSLSGQVSSSSSPSPSTSSVSSNEGSDMQVVSSQTTPINGTNDDQSAATQSTLLAPVGVSFAGQHVPATDQQLGPAYGRPPQQATGSTASWLTRPASMLANVIYHTFRPLSYPNMNRPRPSAPHRPMLGVYRPPFRRPGPVNRYPASLSASQQAQIVSQASQISAQVVQGSTGSDNSDHHIVNASISSSSPSSSSITSEMVTSASLAGAELPVGGANFSQAYGELPVSNLSLAGHQDEVISFASSQDYSGGHASATGQVNEPAASQLVHLSTLSPPSYPIISNSVSDIPGLFVNGNQYANNGVSGDPTSTFATSGLYQSQTHSTTTTTTSAITSTIATPTTMAPLSSLSNNLNSHMLHNNQLQSQNQNHNQLDLSLTHLSPAGEQSQGQSLGQHVGQQLNDNQHDISAQANGIAFPVDKEQPYSPPSSAPVQSAASSLMSTQYYHHQQQPTRPTTTTSMSTSTSTSTTTTTTTPQPAPPVATSNPNPNSNSNSGFGLASGDSMADQHQRPMQQSAEQAQQHPQQPSQHQQAPSVQQSAPVRPSLGGQRRPIMQGSPASPISGASCGVTGLHPQTKVVGGKNAAFGAWPWQVSVRKTNFFGFLSTHRCGGAVISSEWIATAGHCVEDLQLQNIRIRVGEHDFSSSNEPLGYVERSARRKVVHPKYNFYTYENDLALVQLDQPINFMPHVGPICLPPDDVDLLGRNATVTGWGRLHEGGTLPTVLQEVRVPIVSNDKCKDMFLSAGRPEYIPDIFLCAGYEEGGRDSCQGDSGGPLQVRGDDGKWFLAGIISWGIGCAEQNLPGVCTRISRFKMWIQSTIAAVAMSTPTTLFGGSSSSQSQSQTQNSLASSSAPHFANPTNSGASSAAKSSNSSTSGHTSKATYAGRRKLDTQGHFRAQVGS